jgi:hypothetical protein
MGCVAGWECEREEDATVARVRGGTDVWERDDEPATEALGVSG